ncbi:MULTISPECIES: hypothetical protein [unclassified Leifsonia]|uniref:hypothetical protein n=1 Tax=unclassified Leifsonia TaxID=2663824 RepID=UPI0008A7685F|nr:MULTISPECIES: hypothetical protein [unclassified Leifsonia]SEH83977.1 hypothetical protein SAMN04515694_10531 [Leifsonia sp. CL154]SFL46603.1 hypothetical protein SAMN04515692_10530 [Leifsonia sp. CL147]
MAIGARITPELIIFGRVSGHRETKWDGEYTGTVVEVSTPGGPVSVKFRKDADAQRPNRDAIVAVVATAFDGERGSSLTFERYLQPGDLEAIAATFAAPAKS